MSKSPWGGNIGAWAAEAEREEEEERAAAERAAAQAPPQSFPSLKEAVTKQKGKKTKMTLQEFTMQQSSYSVSAQAPSRVLTTEEMLRLPTGPKERSYDEMERGRMGGGFSNYGTLGSNQDRSREYQGRRSGFDDDDRRGGAPQTRVSEFEPSRADGVDNWASMKKQTLPEFNSRQERQVGRYSSLGGGGGGGIASRADEVDNWASVKKPISQPQQQSRVSGFGQGLSRPDSDRWTRNEQRVVSESPKFEVEVVKVNKPNPFGAARPREEVLAEKGLDWKKLDLDIEEKKLVSGGSRPTSSQSSRPESSHSAGLHEGEVKQKPKVNPFGDAKPREVLLEEKGLDWKKIDLDLEHRRVERPETEEEKNMKEEITHLKNELQQKSGDDQTSMHDLILQKERELELLARQLDDKVRYTQKTFERPGSGSGRGPSFIERPPSRPGSGSGRGPVFHSEEPRAGYTENPLHRPGMYEDHRAGFHDRRPSWTGPYEDTRPGFQERPRSRQGAYEEPRGGFPQRSSFRSGAYEEPTSSDYNERPRSRGNSWARPSDDRRALQGGAGRGFLGTRDIDRSGSRW